MSLSLPQCSFKLSILKSRCRTEHAIRAVTASQRHCFMDVIEMPSLSDWRWYQNLGHDDLKFSHLFICKWQVFLPFWRIRSLAGYVSTLQFCMVADILILCRVNAFLPVFCLMWTWSFLRQLEVERRCSLSCAFWGFYQGSSHQMGDSYMRREPSKR